ncbi:siderophore-interacting protein [Gordonia aichiensis]|uniref:Putative siderophore-interacting protein n=1 Tax=Gordonia aichiensis NBRC 108223 TaxID=1220583 RepID=L7KMP0_9ACTN|nr:siderophore-interacting protein [Gordonia aichiensis]GAC50130.1 putative siderophore-interacting protein [Gordonia aichiensis NBRC 108223]
MTDTIKSGIRQRAHANPPTKCTSTVVDITELSRAFIRLVFSADDLADVDLHPADAFKLVLPSSPEASHIGPDRGADGKPEQSTPEAQPVVRALTVRAYDKHTGMLTTDIMRHPYGALAEWLSDLSVGDTVTYVGMRPEWHLPVDVERILLVADGSALPALAAIIESLPEHVGGQAFIALDDDADLALVPAHPGITIEHVRSLGELQQKTPDVAGSGDRIQAWIAAETDAVRSLRRRATQDWGIARDDLLARAYWKSGEDSTAIDSARLPMLQQAMAAGADLHDPALAERIDLELSVGEPTL